MTVARCSGSFAGYFSALDDPRQALKVMYPLDEILLPPLCAVLSGADDFVEMSDWGGMQLDLPRRFHPYANGVPSHDTLNDVFNALDGEQFQACFIAWVDSRRGDDPDEGESIAIDGKTSRRAHDRGKGREPLHLVSAWGLQAASGAWPAGGRGRLQRDHGDPGVVGEAGHHRSPGNH